MWPLAGLPELAEACRLGRVPDIRSDRDKHPIKVDQATIRARAREIDPPEHGAGRKVRASIHAISTPLSKMAIVATTLLAAHPEMLMGVFQHHVGSVGRRGARTCVTELAALKQGASILFDDGSGLEPTDMTEDHIVRLEKWVQVLDAV